MAASGLTATPSDETARWKDYRCDGAPAGCAILGKQIIREIPYHVLMGPREQGCLRC
ncbi:hypothetical protein KCP74_09460 [Salmonella enterica subsp. enterica]|nr:hypothetical protein KCP74_09460 [Salmonella enterica subsp. enterica]